MPIIIPVIPFPITRWLRRTGRWQAMVLSSLFAAQLDYIFFVYGLSFVLMATQCLALRRRDRALPWGLLATFGFIHGVSQWLDMLALSLPDPFLFKGARVVAKAVAFVA